MPEGSGTRAVHAEAQRIVDEMTSTIAGLPEASGAAYAAALELFAQLALDLGLTEASDD